MAAVAAAVVALNVSGIVAYLWSPAPKSPFDAGLTIAAARRLQGLPIYSSAATDQASTMYGPLVPMITSWLFQLFGVGNRAGKILSLVASLAVVGLVLLPTARRNLKAWVVGAALLFSCNHNVSFYFVEARPDMVACLLALIALVLYVRFDSRGDPWAFLASLACFVLAFLAKQPLAVAALVPGVAELCRGGGLSRARLRSFAFAALPPVAVILTVLTLRAYDPTAYFYMITLPTHYRIPLAGLWHSTFEFTVLNPWILLGLLDLIGYGGRRAPETRWWVAGAGVFLVVGLVAMAKEGGWWNSLLPFFIAAAGYATLQVPRLLAILDARDRPIHRTVALSLGLALLHGAVTVRQPGEALRALSGVVVKHGDDRYATVVEIVRSLPGRVLCPEDPTIVLLARGETTRSAVFESDRVLWPSRLPDYVERDLAGAQYVVQITGTWQWIIGDDWLRELGFVRVEEPRLAGSAYALWRKAAD